MPCAPPVIATTFTAQSTDARLSPGCWFARNGFGLAPAGRGRQTERARRIPPFALVSGLGNLDHLDRLSARRVPLGWSHLHRFPSDVAHKIRPAPRLEVLQLRDR